MFLIGFQILCSKGLWVGGLEQHVRCIVETALPLQMHLGRWVRDWITLSFKRTISDSKLYSGVELRP